MENTRNIAPIKLELLLAIVHSSKAAYYSSIIQSHQANVQFMVPAKGTSHLIMSVLSYTEVPKYLIVSVVRSDEAGSLFEQLTESFAKGKDLKGVAFSVKLSSVIGTQVYGFLANDKRTVKQEEKV